MKAPSGVQGAFIEVLLRSGRNPVNPSLRGPFPFPARLSLPRSAGGVSRLQTRPAPLIPLYRNGQRSFVQHFWQRVQVSGLLPDRSQFRYNLAVIPHMHSWQKVHGINLNNRWKRLSSLWTLVAATRAAGFGIGGNRRDAESRHPGGRAGSTS
jgi:hypothetical protein